MRAGVADSDITAKIFFRQPTCPRLPTWPAYPARQRHCPPPPSACRGLLEHVPFMVNGTCPRAGGCKMTTLTVSAPARPGRLWAYLRSDARHFQIAALATLLAFNFAFLDFGARPLNSALAILGSLATQALCSRLARLPAIDLRSPLITGLSLSLLLRADEPWVHALAAIIAIGSQFLPRLEGRPGRNPSRLCIL